MDRNLYYREKANGKVRIPTIATDSELPKFLSVSDLQKIMGIGRNSAYKLIHQKGFPHVRIGNRIVISNDLFINLNTAQKKEGVSRLLDAGMEAIRYDNGKTVLGKGVTKDILYTILHKS